MRPVCGCPAGLAKWCCTWCNLIERLRVTLQMQHHGSSCTMPNGPNVCPTRVTVPALLEFLYEWMPLHFLLSLRQFAKWGVIYHAEVKRKWRHCSRSIQCTFLWLLQFMQAWLVPSAANSNVIRAFAQLCFTFTVTLCLRIAKYWFVGLAQDCHMYT